MELRRSEVRRKRRVVLGQQIGVLGRRIQLARRDGLGADSVISD
jgi:hypothetical protein